MLIHQLWKLTEQSAFQNNTDEPKNAVISEREIETALFVLGYST